MTVFSDRARKSGLKNRDLQVPGRVSLIFTPIPFWTESIFRIFPQSTIILSLILFSSLGGLYDTGVGWILLGYGHLINDMSHCSFWMADIFWRSKIFLNDIRYGPGPGLIFQKFRVPGQKSGFLRLKSNFSGSKMLSRFEHTFYTQEKFYVEREYWTWKFNQNSRHLT